jgi:hypothetical protein
MVSGAAAPTSSTLLVDSVLKMKMPPIAPTAIQNITINHVYYIYRKLPNFPRTTNGFLILTKWHSMHNSDGNISKKTEPKETEDNIKIILGEIYCEDMNWAELSQDGLWY